MISIVQLIKLVLLVHFQSNLFTFGVASPVQKELPSFVHACSRHDADVEACIRQNIEEIKPRLKDGIPELNVPKLEPLFIKELVAADHQVLKISTKDLYVYGPSDFHLGQMHIDPDSHVFKFDVSFPHLRLDGKYTVDGKIIMLQIKGNGNLTGDIYDIKANVTMHGDKMEKDGVNVYHFSDMSIKLKVHKGKIHLSNLFNGDKQLGEMINAAINQNFDAFMKELSPIVEKSLDKFLLGAADGIAESFPFDSLFIE
ncbi:hypothetical protein M8J76_010533 [Diaphorina citri]|nr:hypothetical protein M8J76_010533 [Diaphorina citri]KAI5715132.1 hypothetical protein M8J77_011039 [Diaphorina citri]